MKVLFFLAFVACVASVYSDDDSLVPRCPDEMDGTTMIRHPCNCSTYFVCLTDPPIPMSCPNGLQFDTEKQVCDFKWRVKCKPHPQCPKSFSIDEEAEEQPINHI